MDPREFGKGVPVWWYAFLGSIVLGAFVSRVHVAYFTNGRAVVESVVIASPVVIIGCVFITIADLALVEYYDRKGNSELEDVPDELLP